MRTVRPPIALALLATVGVVATGALVGGCGTSPEETLSQTTSRLGDIRSGTLLMRLSVRPKGDVEGEKVGFDLRGPFSLARPGSLPVTRMAYTQIAGRRRGTVILVSTGADAFIEVGGRAYGLPTPERERLRAGGPPAAGPGEAGLAELHLDRWVANPRLSEGEAVAGTGTDRVRGTLRVVPAVNDLLELSRSTGWRPGAPRRIEGAAARQLEEAVESARIELLTGKEDRLLRRLSLDLHLAVPVPRELRSVLGGLVGARVDLDLGVDDPNRPVRVTAPRHVRPYSELVPRGEASR